MSIPPSPFSDAIAHRFAQVIYRCLEEVGSAKGALYLSLPGESEFHLASHFGFPRLSPPPAVLPKAHPLAAWVNRERRTFAVNEGRKSPDLAMFAMGPGAPRFLISPVYDRGDWVGILIQRDKLKGEPFNLTCDEAPTAVICEAIVDALREYRFLLNPQDGPPPQPRPEPRSAEPTSALPVPVPPTDSMFPPTSPKIFPGRGEAIEGYPIQASVQAGDLAEGGTPVSLVARSGAYATPELEAPQPPSAPASPAPPPVSALRVGMILPEQRTFFWEAASLLGSLVPLSAVALWMDDPEEIRPILAHSRIPLDPALKQQILAHATFHIPKVAETDLQILTRCEWPDEEPLSGVFQTYLPVMLMEEGGGQDLMLIFRGEERPFSDQDQVYIQQIARMLGFHLQESRLHEQYHRSFLTVAHRLLTSVEGGAPKLRSHSLNTARLARNFALSLDLPSADVEGISIAAILHDVGTFMLDPGLLNKPVLDTEDIRSIQTHPLLASTFLKDFRFPVDVMRIIRNHHERWDGAGYPDGLKGELIPVGSRVIALVEAFEVMSSGSEFRPAKTGREILDELRRESGKQFDPNLVAEFLDFLASRARQAGPR
ncbi:MAG TPA: HD domain-containing phosphohydrolase [Holophaga sp.]|nr:HD domain-containing phosphohydrolase [Holophaga sp.]